MKPASRAMATMFFAALTTMCGKVAALGMSSARESAATLPRPLPHFSMSTSSVILSTSGEKMPPSHTYLMLRPYLKGFTPSLVSRAASEVPTLLPSLITSQSLMISIEPLLILVAMLSAWKNEVWAGSRPVGPLGMVQPKGAMTPALAAAGFTYSRMTSSTASRGPLVNTKPRLPTMVGMIASQSGCSPGHGSVRLRMQRRIIVFLPNTSSALPRRAMRISEICLEPTKSASTMNARGYLLRHSSRCAK
mmetsp:Transcript_53083/g.137290  ORF Transcript_53083/g.137290 Transcript_53083/m.137290 type:complete len:249 (+) Transcript_53083:416-1162(+)